MLSAFVATQFSPAYVKLGVAELERRAEAALAGLASCRVCPRDCEVNRLADETAICKIGRYAKVGSAFPHFGEEDCLRGWKGSGTIFFSLCNLRCVFCQNFDISQAGGGSTVTPDRLAALMLSLQDKGCHNVNFVTPEHVVPQILEALPHAVRGGLRLPLVYNTSAYDSLESLRHLDGIVDIYMPDFKVWDRQVAKRYLKAPDYPEAARAAVKEMHRQVGPLSLDERGLARRGLLVRHLVMPGGLGGTREVMRFLAQEVSPDTYVNIMSQYYPAGLVNEDRYPEINRHVTAEEMAEARRTAEEEGLHRFDERRKSALRWLN
ncbi:MAG: radical SAM protein [candidate division NC10 bacterium]|nr:radical SAM protein [candidate division NC10 bacterium]